MRSPRRKAPSVPASLQRSASASNRRFSLPENWRRLAIATTSGSRRAAASEAVSPVALRAPSATASEEQPNDPFIEDFSNEVMCMSYLYSKLPETGVSPHIGTGGGSIMLCASRCIRSFIVIVLMAFATLAPAYAANWLEETFYMSGPRYDGVLPPCEAALGKIASRFAQKEGRFWNSDLQILGFERVQETAFRPWAADTIPRRFCSAVALVSDGHKHAVNYSIGED